MFEIFVALKYLIPRKRQLSVSLIATISVAVISLVVWLVLVFLSVTAGIERNWLEKLTTLNAPVRITPTPAYYSSYYYQIDRFASASDYRYRSIGEKARAQTADPYNPNIDSELPRGLALPDLLPNGELKDPVKSAMQILEGMKPKVKGLTFQDFELSGGLLRIQMIRPESKVVTLKGDETESILTQVSYLFSLCDKSPKLSSLILPPTADDFNNLLFLVNRESGSVDNRSVKNNFTKELSSLLAHTSIKKLKPSQPFWNIPLALLPEGKSFDIEAMERNGKISHFMFTDRPTGKVMRTGSSLFYNGVQYPSTTLLLTTAPLVFQASLIPSSIESARELGDLKFVVRTNFKNEQLQGVIPFEGLEVADIDIESSFNKTPPTSFPWISKINEKLTLPSSLESGYGILLAKNFRETGVKLGDQGYLSYSSTTASSQQEQRLPIFVSGFYDPGVIGIGGKSILVPHEAARIVNASNNAYAFDRTQSSGLLVWFNDLNEADNIKTKLNHAFAEAGIGQYWKVTTFKEYDQAKDLIQQFQSDKYLFTLVGILILMVGCSNIVSMLVLLVNDKKKEIGILQAMGASWKNIAFIFGFCGFSLGLVSTLVGIGAAIFTLSHIDGIVSLLSFLQGHEAFNTLFYGQSLPNALSNSALLFILIATPLLSLIAGLVPAWKACRLKPSEILRDL